MCEVGRLACSCSWPLILMLLASEGRDQNVVSWLNCRLALPRTINGDSVSTSAGDAYTYYLLTDI